MGAYIVLTDSFQSDPIFRSLTMNSRNFPDSFIGRETETPDVLLVENEAMEHGNGMGRSRGPPPVSIIRPIESYEGKEYKCHSPGEEVVDTNSIESTILKSIIPNEDISSLCRFDEFISL